MSFSRVHWEKHCNNVEIVFLRLEREDLGRVSSKFII